MYSPFLLTITNIGEAHAKVVLNFMEDSKPLFSTVDILPHLNTTGRKTLDDRVGLYNTNISNCSTRHRVSYAFLCANDLILKSIATI